MAITGFQHSCKVSGKSFAIGVDGRMTFTPFAAEEDVRDYIAKMVEARACPDCHQMPRAIREDS